MYKRIYRIIAAVVVLTFASLFYSPKLQRKKTEVVRVIDGDTIVIKSKAVVRYISIDAPEKNECFAKKSKQYNSKLVLGKEILLEKDVGYKDKYGRLLRYVYVKNKNGHEIFVNKELVRKGYASISIYPPDVRHIISLSLAQVQAILNNRGMWGECK